VTKNVAVFIITSHPQFSTKCVT